MKLGRCQGPQGYPAPGGCGRFRRHFPAPKHTSTVCGGVKASSEVRLPIVPRRLRQRWGRCKNIDHHGRAQTQLASILGDAACLHFGHRQRNLIDLPRLWIRGPSPRAASRDRKHGPPGPGAGLRQGRLRLLRLPLSSSIVWMAASDDPAASLALPGSSSVPAGVVLPSLPSSARVSLLL